ncbi:hypothetical protein ACOSQ3_012229 [Xanthoceras sorbifolium]
MTGFHRGFNLDELIVPVGVLCALCSICLETTFHALWDWERSFEILKLAVEVGLQPVVIVSQDSTNVVNLLLPRNANKAANSLAKAALSVDEELFLPKDTHPCTEDIYPPLFVLMFPGFGY